MNDMERFCKARMGYAITWNGDVEKYWLGEWHRFHYGEVGFEQSYDSDDSALAKRPCTMS